MCGAWKHNLVDFRVQFYYVFREYEECLVRLNGCNWRFLRASVCSLRTQRVQLEIFEEPEIVLPTIKGVQFDVFGEPQRSF